MARNIRDVLSEDRAALAERAVAAASAFDWERVLETLFGSLYRQALERRVNLRVAETAE
jgi:hypothetical protein